MPYDNLTPPPFTFCPLVRSDSSLQDADLTSINLLIRLRRFRLEVLLGQHTRHTQYTPHPIGRLRTHTNPILCARDIEIDVLVEFSLAAVRIGFRDRVVCSYDFEWLAAACCPLGMG